MGRWTVWEEQEKVKHDLNISYEKKFQYKKGYGAGEMT